MLGQIIQKLMSSLRNWVGIWVIKNVSCVVTSVRVTVLVICCGSVQHYSNSSRADFNRTKEVKHFDALDSLGKSSFILNCGKTILIR